MAKQQKRVSYCLRHQERPAETRCETCLKPLCADCIQLTDLGKFCSLECHERRQASGVRADDIRAKDDASQVPASVRLYKTVMHMAFYVLALFLAYMAWTQWLPMEWKKPLLEIFKASSKPA